MKTPIKISVIVVFLSATLLFAASEVAKTKADDSVATALRPEWAAALAHTEELGKRFDMLSVKIEGLVAKAKNKSLPIDGQLSRTDLDEFNLATAQLRFIAGQIDIENRKMQDFDLFIRLHRASIFMADRTDSYLGRGSDMSQYDSYITSEAKAAGLDQDVSLLVAMREIANQSKGKPPATRK